jgi:hypothetical protein
MPRSAGVTTSAVIVLIGSVFTILGGVMMLLASTFLAKSSSGADLPPNLGHFVAVESIVFFAFGGWGLAAGIGLIYLKQWARISTMIYAGILVVFTLPMAVFIAIVPIFRMNDPSSVSNSTPIIGFGMAFFYAAFAALGGFWLYFFNQQDVRLQFRGGRTDTPPARPLSITIIGWILAVSSAIAPLSLLFVSTLFSGVQLPLYFLGVFFFGRTASLILIIWMAAQMVAAVGLLKLKNWARLATIGLQCLAVVNALLILIPANRARFQQVMEAMTASMMSTRLTHPPSPAIPMWSGFAFSLPLFLVALWFLITERHAFTHTAPGQPL